MKETRTIKLFRTLALLLVFAVLCPSAVKFSHIFKDHKHEVCLGESKVHFHELELDCEFYKFQISNVLHTDKQNFDILEVFNISKDFADFYISYKQLQQLTRFQRGPPEVS